MPEWRYPLFSGDMHLQDEQIFLRDPFFRRITVQDNAFLPHARMVEVTFAGTPSYESMARLQWRQAEAIPAVPLAPIPNLNGDVLPPMDWLTWSNFLAAVHTPVSSSLNAFLQGVRAIYDKGEVAHPRSRNRFDQILAADGELTITPTREGFSDLTRRALSDVVWPQEIHGYFPPTPDERIPGQNPCGEIPLDTFLVPDDFFVPLPVEGPIPVRSDVTVLSADEPSGRALGWVVRENVGRVAVNPRGLTHLNLVVEPEVEAPPPVEEAPAEPILWPSRWDRL